ncbi:mucin-2-like [Saccostrea cucullata]|uniref:mucin-2-like n=1 Tax=Saccostrea cuccullata TaxID=36930 RepID=UPI002ED389FB
MSLLSSALCLECHLCYFAKDPALCQHHVTCNPGQSCGKLKYEDFTGSHYDLDCVDTSICSNADQTQETVQIFGRRGTNSDVVCCHTDLCNKYLSNPAEQGTTTAIPANSSTELLTTVTIFPSTTPEVTTSTPDSCTDHPDCDVLTQGFHACNDSDIALIVCRKSCGMCDVTTTKPVCRDAHPDCQILSDHLNVCADDNFARTRCPWTCGLCDSHSSSTTFTTLSSTTQQQSGVCVDGHDCVLLKELNICKNPMTAQLCPVYCGICQNNTGSSTTEFSTFSQQTESTLTSSEESTIQTTELGTASQISTQITTQTTTQTAKQTTKLTTKATTTMPATTEKPCRDTLPSADCQRILTETATACSQTGTRTVCKVTCNLCDGNTIAVSSINTPVAVSSLEATTSSTQNSQGTTETTGTKPTTSKITTQPITTTLRTTRRTTASEVGVVVVG